MRVAPLALIVLFLAGCKTTNSDNWTGSGVKPFRQAETTCLAQTRAIAQEDDRRDFFIGCMSALGWTPRPGASIDL